MPTEKDDPLWLGGGSGPRKPTRTQIANAARAAANRAAGLPPPVGDPEPIRTGGGGVSVEACIFFGALLVFSLGVMLGRHLGA